MDTMRREMDTEKTHVRLLAMNSNLKKCQVYIDREKKSNESTKRMFAALVLSASPRQRRVVDTRCVPHCGLRMGPELYRDCPSITALGGHGFWEFRVLQSLT